MRRAGITLAALTTLATLAVPAASSALASAKRPASRTQPASAKPAAPEVRVNQVGYQPNAPKSAYVMLPARVASVPFTASSTPAPSSTAASPATTSAPGTPATRRSTCCRSPDCSGAARTGSGSARPCRRRSRSPTEPRSTGAGRATAVRYFTSERDGADVEHSVLGRKPANLTDAKALPSTPPRYDDNDNLLGPLKQDRRPGQRVRRLVRRRAAGTRSSATPPATRTR